jgi:deoxyribodipyrimidine photolyase
VSERFRLIPLQNCLFTPELQWQSRGKCRISQRRKLETPGPGRQIDWDDNPAYVKAWKEGQTGYPWIDAAMTQLRREGWLHHLARHAVACFLTRGDLYQSWEVGAKIFDL